VIAGGPELTISVVLYNSKGTLVELAASLREAVTTGFAEVIAVDNASTDGSADAFAELLPGAHLIRNSQNRGYAAANNQTWPYVRGRYWVLLNPDVKTDDPSLRKLVDWMDRWPDVGVATPLLCDPAGTEETVARPLPGLGWRTLEMLRLHRLMTARARSRHLMGPYWQGEDRIRGWIPGAAMILRGAAVESVGPLTERSFMYGEDVELCWRMHRRGWGVGVCHDCEFVHTRGWSSESVWGEEEVERRIAAGELAVVSDVKGRLWARLYAGIVGVSHFVESLHPRRSKEQRGMNRRIARTWLRHVTG
jgi:GT2 family glycosyltransferase